MPPERDRKSVVEGKSVDLGGRRIIKKKKTQSEREIGNCWGFPTWWRPLRTRTALRPGRSARAPPRASIRYALMAEVHVFFQAEDGIRDYKVTGVQPCALPI